MENDMRIICDHCSRPISGAVKRLAGNFNLHPDCLVLLGKDPKHESTAASWQSLEFSTGTLAEWREAVPGASLETEITPDSR
jgi:hypothetical protein